MAVVSLRAAALLAVFLANVALAASNPPKALMVTTEAPVYREPSEEGSAPTSPAGIYVHSGDVHSYPHYTRDASNDVTPSHMYRSTKGIWVITNSSANFHSNKGSFISTKASDSPIGLKWRYHAAGKWPADNTLAVDDVSAEWAEEELRRGPPKVVVRTCPGGVGDVGAPAYTYSPVPATFSCWSSSPYCVHNSSVYCHFKRDDVDAIIEALDEELHHLSASFVVLEDEQALLDGRGQTEALTKRVQAELFQASYRVYLSAPWFGLTTYIQVADAILLFSVCASYGVAAGIFFASAHDKKTKQA